MHFSERVMWELELAVAREGMLSTKGKRLPVTSDLNLMTSLPISDIQKGKSHS